MGCGVEEKPQAQNSIYSSWIPEGGVGEEGGIPSPPALRKNGALKALALIGLDQTDMHGDSEYNIMFGEGTPPWC